MKKLLLATTMLVGTAGFAAAEVTLSGDARMGIVDSGPGDVAFSSRARVAFTLSGETDGGLSFGASFRADNAGTNGAAAGGGAVNGDAGSVFISGAFGKLSMGDVDGAAQMATGHVAGIGYTGVSDLNESTFLGAGSGLTDPTALYEYSTGAFTGYASVTNPGAPGDETYAIGAKYSTDAYTFGIGYEDTGAITHVVVKGSATFSGVTVQALYGEADLGATKADQFAVSAGYSLDGIGLTAYYSDDSELPGGAKAYGIGASYDLGGGAAIAGGVAKNQTANTRLFDLGVTFKF
ncbi:MAG: hypothetical protein RIR62_2973 [Pseudomonadota bacterium]